MLHLGAGMVVVVIVCVSFLLMMIVLGVVRIHRTQRHGNNNRGGASGVACDEKNEMEWDNSALTITVNPMDQEDEFADDALAGVHGNDSDSDDDLSSYHGDLADDGLDSSEDDDDDEAVVGVRAMKTRALEWDESDLSKFHCKV